VYLNELKITNLEAASGSVCCQSAKMIPSVCILF